MPRPRIAICYFGITRSLPYTLDSLTANVVRPAKATGEIRVFAHLFRQERIDNAATGEVAELDPDDHRLLEPDDLQLEAPEVCLDQWNYDRLREAGDAWNDGFRSLRNLVHQLHSLHAVTRMAACWNPHVWIFARPDLRYHDSLRPVLSLASKGGAETVWLPLWQSRGGRNDRFAIIRGGRAARTYGMRAERMADFCTLTGGPLHSERLLGFVLREERVRLIKTRATRVRANGFNWPESFSFEWLERLHSRLERSPAPRLVRRVGHRGLRTVQQVIELPFQS